MKHKAIATAFVMATTCAQAFAGEADVVDVEIEGSGTEYRFSVTVKHADEGWEHYVNRWEVLDTHGNVLGKRILAHPHVEEQPFTRSATISIPAEITSVVVRAHDSVDGYGGKEVTVSLPGR